MKYAFAIIGCCLALSACSHQYVKEGVDSAKRQDDMNACLKAMSRFSGDEAKAAYDKCMADRGYEKKDKLDL